MFQMKVHGKSAKFCLVKKSTAKEILSDGNFPNDVSEHCHEQQCLYTEKDGSHVHY